MNDEKQVSVDPNKLIAKLQERLGQAHVQIAMCELAIDDLQQQIGDARESEG